MVTKHDIHVIFMRLKAICVRIGIDLSRVKFDHFMECQIFVIHNN